MDSIDPYEIDVNTQHLAFESYIKAHAPGIFEKPSVMPVHHLEDAPKISHKLYQASVGNEKEVEAPSKPCKLKSSCCGCFGPCESLFNSWNGKVSCCKHHERS